VSTFVYFQFLSDLKCDVLQAYLKQNKKKKLSFFTKARGVPMVLQKTELSKTLMKMIKAHRKLSLLKGSSENLFIS